MTPEELAEKLISDYYLQKESYLHTKNRIAAAIREAVAEEREACAQLADAIAEGCSYDLSSSGDEEGCANRIAEAIRQRKDQ